MKNLSKKIPFDSTADEKRSVEILMQRMGISKKEIQQITGQSGVSASKMIELMQLSKYQFVVNDEKKNHHGRCIVQSGMRVSKFR